jgi:C-terminal processing protease CtpA/Prc
MKNSLLNSGWVLGLVLIGLAGCDPVPRRTLTTEEKIADLYWIYSQFGENYAPLEMKQKLHGLDYEKWKADTIEAAKLTKTNDEFYQLMMKFVAGFKDAHTSASLTNSSLPNRAQVAFLGFGGYRHGDSLIVKKLLPTIASDSAYPVKPGDEIIAINGLSLKDAIDRDLVPLRDLGNREANYTFHMNKLFNRVSTVNGLPAEADAVLTIKRDDRKFTVKLPWVMKDLVQFRAEQDAATQKTKSGNFLMVSDDADPTRLFSFNFIGFDGKIFRPMEQIEKVTRGLRKKFSDGFRMIDSIAGWSPVDEAVTSSVDTATPMEKLKEVRAVPANAVYVDGSKTYPAYIVPAKVKTADGTETREKRLVGYILIDTFSPSSDEDEVIAEFKNTLSSMQALGVQHLVLDTINNGGGSLVLGMKMAQLLSPSKIEMPKIQYRLSDSWLDQFESESLQAASDSEREYSRRLLASFLQQKDSGNRLSSIESAETLAPFSINENRDLEQPFKVVLLVNEMCASMCDIFAGILQDNQMATVMGARTMGAGGNVVAYNQAPNSHLELRQTESLIVRKNPNADQTPSYIENFGIEPEVEIKVNEMAKTKYVDAIKKAMSEVTKQ